MRRPAGSRYPDGRCASASSPPTRGIARARPTTTGRRWHARSPSAATRWSCSPPPASPRCCWRDAGGCARWRAGDASALTPTPRVPLVVAVGLGVPVSHRRRRAPRADSGGRRRRRPARAAARCVRRRRRARSRSGRPERRRAARDADAGRRDVLPRRTVAAPGPRCRAARGPRRHRRRRLAVRRRGSAPAVRPAGDGDRTRSRSDAVHALHRRSRRRWSRSRPRSPTRECCARCSTSWRRPPPRSRCCAPPGSSALRSLVPASLAGRVRLPDASTPAARAAALRGASIFIAARNGSPLIAREAGGVRHPDRRRRRQPGARTASSTRCTA